MIRVYIPNKKFLNGHKYVFFTLLLYLFFKKSRNLGLIKEINTYMIDNLL